MAEYAQHIRLTAVRSRPTPGTQNATAAAAASLKKGRSLLKSLGNAPRRSSSTSSIPDPFYTTPSAPQTPPVSRAASTPSISDRPDSSSSSSAASTSSPSHPASAASSRDSTPLSASSTSPLPVDAAAASLELSRYSAEGLYDPEVDEHGEEVEVNLIEYWEVCKLS